MGSTLRAIVLVMVLKVTTSLTVMMPLLMVMARFLEARTSVMMMIIMKNMSASSTLTDGRV